MTSKSDHAGMRRLTVVKLAEGRSEITGEKTDALLTLDLKDIRDIIFVEDMDFQVIYVSPGVTALFGYTTEEIKRVEKKDFMTPDSLHKAMKSFQKYCTLAQNERDIDIPLMEYEYVRKDGSTFWGELKVNFIKDSKGRLIGSQGILRDIDDRKKMEMRLLQSENKFRTIFDLSPLAIALTQVATGKLIDVNKKFCELTKYHKAELVGKKTTDLGFYSERGRKKFINELSTLGEVRSLDMDFRTKDGSVLNAQMFAKMIEVENEQLIITVFHDRTHEKRLERQFLQAQKMESIGILAGSIAHDFNNFLMAIEGYVFLMLSGTDKLHPNHPMLCSISEHVKSCTQLTQQLLGYAKKGQNDSVSLDLNQLIKETSKSIKGAIQQVAIRQDLEAELLSVEGDAVQIRQVLYNLYINAADAMPNGGELFIKTSNVSYEEMAGRAYKPKKKKYVSIIVADTGIGMNKMIIDHLFEPFFTTKESGKGTGLGLASVYGIVKGHAGYIDVESQPGKGTIFSIYLPASRKLVKTAIQAYTEPIKASGTILIVDDNNTVLEVTSRMLERMNFKVIKADSGRQAIGVYKEQAAKIDLVILDMMMPEMKGHEVFDKIKEMDPNAKVLASSGYGSADSVSDMLKRGCLGFIQKPFDINKLSQKIKEILN